MSKADNVAFDYAKENGTLGQDYNQIYDATKYGYNKGVNEVLTWENLKRLDEIMTEVWNDTNLRKDEPFYTEVINRFKKENNYE